MLINNSGFGDYGRQQDSDRAKQLQMIDLNVRAVVDLTAQLLPQMLERGGCVVNVASTAELSADRIFGDLWRDQGVCVELDAGIGRGFARHEGADLGGVSWARRARISLNQQVLRLRRCRRGPA